MKNTRIALELSPDDLQRHRNRYIILKDENIGKLQRVFGVYSYSKCIKCKLEEINQTALSLIKNEKTFRISAKKFHSLDKSSVKINEEVGEYILNNKKIKVDLENPEINIRIEEVSKKAYLYTEIIKGPGGLPAGTSGFVFLRVKNELYATVAAYLMMKRGCTIVLSKELPLLNKFNYIEIKVIEERDQDYVVTDEIFENLNLKEEKKFIMSPLIGYSEEEIKKLYEKIKSI